LTVLQEIERLGDRLQLSYERTKLVCTSGSSASSCRPILTSRGSGNAKDFAMTRRSTPAPRFPFSLGVPYEIKRSGV